MSLEPGPATRFPKSDTELVFDPATYTSGVPFERWAGSAASDRRVVEEPAVLGWSGGPGFWLVLRHATWPRS